MLETRNDIFREVLVRSNRTTTDAFVTDVMLENWLDQAHVWAASKYKWPFTEGRIQTTFAAGTGPGGDEYFFEGFKADSFRLVQIGGKKLKKLNFDDYQILREYEPVSTERVFTDFGRTVFVNPTIDLSGTLVAYGQLQPLIDSNLGTQTTVFSGYEDEGNEAIVEYMLGIYFSRETQSAGSSGGNIVSPSMTHITKANDILDRLWKRILDEQYNYQTHPDRGGMFERIDVLNGGTENNEDQF